jgi:hypothetical protein
MQSAVTPVLRHLQSASTFFDPPNSPARQTDDLQESASLDLRKVAGLDCRQSKPMQRSVRHERHANRQRSGVPISHSLTFARRINIRHQQSTRDAAPQAPQIPEHCGRHPRGVIE